VILRKFFILNLLQCCGERSVILAEGTQIHVRNVVESISRVYGSVSRDELIIDNVWVSLKLFQCRVIATNIWDVLWWPGAHVVPSQPRITIGSSLRKRIACICHIMAPVKRWALMTDDGAQNKGVGAMIDTLDKVAKVNSWRELDGCSWLAGGAVAATASTAPDGISLKGKRDGDSAEGRCVVESGDLSRFAQWRVLWHDEPCFPGIDDGRITAKADETVTEKIFVQQGAHRDLALWFGASTEQSW
jgi:hypothetical protein